ncbi:MAG: helix-turn-helix transcriptional regulator [Clostridiaceae bacterium]|nr:helix-turn-helix transcriptional regulator [Clostridiaceae bacterium]
MKNEKYQDIFQTSHRLFLQQGYENTTIRQISDHASVSLGLINHCFHSKQELAGLMLDMLFSYSNRCCDNFYSSQEDPLLHTSLCTRVNTLYLLRGQYHRFYLDCLKYDIFFQKLEKRPNTSLYQLAAIHNFPVDDDLFLLYGKYVPYNFEKTLILNKESGLFPSIRYDEIPDYIIISKFEHFLDRKVLDDTLSKAHTIAGNVLDSMPDIVPDSFVLDFISD